jgi:hypothetical protein
MWPTPGTNRVEEFSPVGPYQQAFTASGLSGNGGQINKPSGVVVDPAGNLDIVDSGDNQVVGPTGTLIAN